LSSGILVGSYLHVATRSWQEVRVAEVDWTEQHWRKSQRSNTTEGCVEYAVARETVAIRDSKDPDGPILTFSHDSWRAFVEAIKSGEFDRR
jgi:hypothetical protein